MRAIISDIHSNIEAFRAVLEHVRGQRIGEIFCLGDVVGYGPDPEDCIDEAMKCDLCLMGNHDEAAFLSPFGFNAVARQAIDWTRERIEPTWHSGPTCRARWQFLTSLPLTHKIDTITFVHGGPRAPTWDYILDGDTAAVLGEPSEKLVETFEMIDGPCFVGHTHIPGVIEGVDGDFMTPDELGGVYEYHPSRKAIINVGSVGQPRDGDPRACYVTMDETVVAYHRVEYDWQKTCRRIIEIPGLPDLAGERLVVGR